MKQLIVNADDFGLTEGVNRAVCELHSAGSLTSTTLMANAEHTVSAATRAFALPDLGIGCHVVLVDGTPILPAAQIPSLVDPAANPGSIRRSGSTLSTPVRFRPTLAGFITDLLRGRIRESEIEAEATAQLLRLQQAGVGLTHLDTHKHTHMFSRVLRPLLRAAVLCGIPSIRNPFEPDWSLAATRNAGSLRRLQVRLLRSQRDYFLTLTRELNVATTDGALGVLATGSLDAATLRRILEKLPDGNWELVCHPGYHDAALDGIRTRLLQSREVERAALLHVIPETLAVEPALSLIHFGQLTSRQISAASSRGI